MTEFDTFWQLYPRKCGKLIAEKAYRQALTKATACEIMDGLAWQVVHEKWRTEPQFIPYPASWLRAGRWLDERPRASVAFDADWFEDCRERHGGACEGDRMRHHIRRQVEKFSGDLP